MTELKLISELAKNSPQVLIDEMSRWYLLSRSIHVAAELGLADEIGQLTISAVELAKKINANPELLERLLRYLASHGIFEEVTAGMFKATNLSDILTSDSPQSIRPMLRVFDKGWWNATSNLLHAIKTGECAFNYTTGKSFFDYLADNPVLQKKFDEGMTALSGRYDKEIVAAYDFTTCHTIADIGGGRGGILAEILSRYSQIKCILFDQAQVISDISHLKIKEFLSRCELISGDFFDNVPTADTYLLKSVLHDWNDQDSIKILSNCREAMLPKGKILVIERIIFPTRNKPHPANDMDMTMMILLNGKERTIEDWNNLIDQAQLKLNKIIDTNSEFSILEIVQK